MAISAKKFQLSFRPVGAKSGFGDFFKVWVPIGIRRAGLWPAVPGIAGLSPAAHRSALRNSDLAFFDGFLKMKINFTFRPKLCDTLKNYSAPAFFADLTAGLIVGIVSLPLAIALAIASGLKPEIGIFTAIIGGFLVSALGGSRVQIGGPAGAFVPLLAPIVLLHGPQALVVCALMAGVILFALGACRLGTMIKYIPFPVVTGFTSGIAIIILSTQIKDFFGLPQKLPADFLGKLRALADGFQPNWPTVFLALAATLAI